MKPDSELIRAYLNTTYEVYEPNIIIRIGEHNEKLDKLLIEHEEHSWMFITAHNPGSRKLSDNENSERNSSLLADLDSYKVFKGRGIGDTEKWDPEESYLVLGIPLSEATALGKKYGQNAIVFGRSGGLPELVLTN